MRRNREADTYCEGLDQKHNQVTCKLGDRTDLTRGAPGTSLDGKRRLTAPVWIEADNAA